MTQINKDDLKQPDIATQTLREGFQWTTQHSLAVLGIAVVGVLIGLGLVGLNWWKSNQEMKASAAYYKIEKELQKKQEQFDLFESSTQIRAAAEDARKLDKKKAQNKKDKTNEGELPAIEGLAATGDLTKDYGQIPQQLESVIQSFPNSAAGQLAALTGASLYLKHGQFDQALGILSKTKKSTDLMQGLVSFQKAKALADAGQCPEAVKEIDSLLKVKATKFVHQEAQLKQAFCYEKMKELDKAEQIYRKLMAEQVGSPTSKMAEKFLRLLLLGKKPA
jgi:predicted negative regulator of RcsB-dependent stress response